MRCKAMYTGPEDRFGAKCRSIYEIDVFTINSDHGTPYLWVRIPDCPEYMMPYVNILALMDDWWFSTTFDESELHPRQDELVRRWLDIYTPEICESIARKIG